MAILPDKQLRKLVQDNSIYVENGPEVDEDLQIGPSSIDLRLGYEFAIMETRRVEVLDTKEIPELSKLQHSVKKTPDEGFVVHPGEFVLSTTMETVEIPSNMVARIEGRSSYARLGLIPHAAGGFIDAGFEGQITLEIRNLGDVPIKIYPEDRICQMAVETMTAEAETPYGDKADAKYMGQKGATGARLNQEKR